MKGVPVPGPDGTKRRVKLECRRFGNKMYTTRRWLDEFGREVAEAYQQAHEQREQETKKSGGLQRKRLDVEDDERALAEAGI